MELTKWEKMVMNPKYRWRLRLTLLIGIISVLASIGFMFWTYHAIKTFNNSISQNYDKMKEDISPKTDLEHKLKNSLLKSFRGGAEGWRRHLLGQGLTAAGGLLMVGFFLIFFFFYFKKCSRLINKLYRNLIG